MRLNFFLLLLSATSLLFPDEEIAKAELPIAKMESSIPGEGYTINYNTISMIEYLRFASKICKVNFIYNETDLNFTITVISDEPVSEQNVMATLIQVLRIHGLMLLEQDNSLVIHRSTDVKQLATLVTEGSPASNASIVTRIFRLRNAKPASVAAIVQPMISSSALLEVSAETRQLIVTDLTANVNKIAALIENLDSPHTLLEIRSFSAQHNKPDFLIELASQIMNPIAQGNPFILVPQNLANEVFIVSTPELVQQALNVFTNLDTPPKGDSGPERRLRAENIFVYKATHRPGGEILKGLKNIGANLEKTAVADPDLLHTIDSAKWIQETNSIMLVGTPDSINKTKEFIAALDVSGDPSQGNGFSKPGYYIYKVQNTTGDFIEEDLDALAKNFKSSGIKDAKILEVISKVRYISQTNSLLLSGDPKAIEEVKALIAQYDYPRTASGPAKNNFLMYKPINLPAAKIQKSLAEVATNLKSAGLADESLLNGIESAKYVEATNSILFTGSPDSLQKIQALLHDVDVPPSGYSPIHVGKTTFLLYKLKNAGGPQIVSSLKNMTAELKKNGTSDKELLITLSSMKYIKETNSLFFSGTEDSLGKVQILVEKFDVTSLANTNCPPGSGPNCSNFFVYKTQSLSGPELEKLLQDFSDNLRSSGLNDPDLFNAIASTRWTEKTQTLVFTGTPKALDQVKELLKEFDIASNGAGSALAGRDSPIQAIDNTSFLVYKLQFHKGDEIQGALRQIAKDLMISNAPINQGLLNSINSIQWLEVTNSLLCSGDQETLTRLRELVKNLDIPLKQVFIEMLMIETTLANALTFGLEWGANYKYRDKFSTNTYNTPANLLQNGTPDPFITNLSGINPTTPPIPSKIPAPGSGFDLGVIGEVIRHNGETFLTLGSLLSALQIDDETSIIMTPKIITQDGRTSTLFRGENIPFVGSFVSNSGNNTVNTSNIEYRDIGVSLTITPVLGNSDIVTLDISFDRSQTVGDITQANLNPGAQTANGIITSKTTMQTTVHVPDNNFLVLTGMVNNSNVKSKNGIPCLGGLPAIGALFSKNNDSITNSNIVIFIRPHIINSIEDMRKITAKEEDYFRDQAGTPFLEKNFDEAMELIKTVDDE